VATTTCIFDAYGTLFDVHSAVAQLADRMGPDAEQLSELWRQKQLEYSWTRSLMQRYADFWQITEEALDYAMARFGYHNSALRSALLRAYRELGAYPEVRDVLLAYRSLGVRVAVFSNATDSMLATALDAARLDDLVDVVYSAHSVGVFKPDVRVYAAAAKSFGVFGSEIAFHSSNGWDAAGAASCGWGAMWINRAGRPQEYPWLNVPAKPDLGAALADFAQTATRDPGNTEKGK
jgi:2-haloacid dehalogenase